MKPPTPSDRLAVRERPKDRTPIMYQSWRSLLFLHWEYDVEAIQNTLPAGLQVDTFAGKAYIGIVPFFMQDVHPRLVPTIPGLSDFQELNVRTYMYDDRGIPGVWFYSLDANQWVAVQAARMIFRLPYFHAKMCKEINPETNEVIYSSKRSGADPLLTTHFRYRPMLKAATQRAEPNTLEFFLDGLSKPNGTYDHAIMSPGVDVEVFGLERVA